MGLWLLGLFALGLLFYGTYLIYKIQDERFFPVLYVVVKNQADTVEGILRYLVQGIRRRGFPGTVIIIDDYSQDETMEILTRLAQELNLSLHRTYGAAGEEKFVPRNEGTGVYCLLLDPQTSYKAGLKEAEGFLRHCKTDKYKSKVLE